MATRFQFSIRFLLVATVAVASGIAAARAAPSWQTVLAIDALTLFYATGAICGVMQTSDRERAFWMGTAVVFNSALLLALLDSLATLRYVSQGWEGSAEVVFNQRFLWPVWCAAPVNGLFAVVLHWLFSPRSDGPQFPGVAVIAVLLLMLGATFVGGMRFGEWREACRREREEQRKEAGGGMF